MSQKRDSSDDGTQNSKHPFKKARYEWEIKRTRRKYNSENHTEECSSDNSNLCSPQEKMELQNHEINTEIVEESESFVDSVEKHELSSAACSMDHPNFCESDSKEPSVSIESFSNRATQSVASDPLPGCNLDVGTSDGTSETTNQRMFMLPAHNIISESLVNLTEYVPLSSNVDGVPLSHQLERLQNRHISKAIVDNAINHTLEDMGICPNTYTSSTVHHKDVESDAISAAIRSEGLQIPYQQTIPPPSLDNNPDSDSESEDDDLLESEFQDTCNLIQGSQSRETTLLSQVSAHNQSRLIDDALSVAISARGLVLRNT